MKMSFIGQIDGDTVEHHLVVDDHNGDDGIYTIILDGKSYNIDAKAMPSAIISAIIDSKSYDLDIDEKDQSCDPLDGRISIRVKGRVVRLEMLQVRHKKMKEAKKSIFLANGTIAIKSPMPGKILRFLAKTGDCIKKGQGLVVVEAMKMENELQSPKDGVVKSINVQVETTVDGDTTLLIIE